MSIESSNGVAVDGVTLFHDEDTMAKVHAVLAAAGLDEVQRTDAVNSLQNAGILFRERAVTPAGLDLRPNETFVLEAARHPEGDSYVYAGPAVQYSIHVPKQGDDYVDAFRVPVVYLDVDHGTTPAAALTACRSLVQWTD